AGTQKKPPKPQSFGGFCMGGPSSPLPHQRDQYTSFCVLCRLKWPVGVTRRGSLMTFFSLSVLSSTTTMALTLSLALHTENQTSSPALLNSGCTTRLAPSSLMSAHSAMGSVT